ncbi:vacuolar protein sorting-associated protein 37D [Elgaria multicarinata webbii]|uniref:vacuolar protein sorting-associated protein 37D n=1 Tax=Elgaria multicarinata webbii TaxID=159646 RepID=UPI002FCD0A63
MPRRQRRRQEPRPLCLSKRVEELFGGALKALPPPRAPSFRLAHRSLRGGGGPFKSVRGAPWRPAPPLQVQVPDRAAPGAAAPSASLRSMERDRGPRGSAAVDLGFGALSTAQLRALMRDETWLERIVKLSRKFQNLQLEREMRLASNYALAKQNLALQPRLENGKTSLAIKYQELRELREACRDKQQRLGACMAKWTPENAVKRLQVDLDGVETKVEEQMEQFLCWDLPIETFVESFQHSRMLSHLRRTQLEKLQEILKLEKEKTPDKPSPGAEKQPATSPELRPVPPTLVQAAPVQNGPPPPKVFQLRLAPAFLIPSEAVLPLPVAPGPQKCCLPTLAASHPTAPFVSKPLSLIGHIHLPQAHLPHQQKKKEPPHR